MFKRPTQNFGFSLLELLVVISIIGILVAVGTASYTGAQKKVRDSRRMQDLKAIQNAQEQYYITNGSYVHIRAGVSDNTCFGSIPEAMDKVPTDPKNVTPYTYRCFMPVENNRYCAHVLLEASAGNCGGCTPQGQFSEGATFFCIKNLQ